MTAVHQSLRPVTTKAAPRLIGLCGYARSGKDTIGTLLVDYYGYERRAFADKLRALAWAVSPAFGALVQAMGYEVVKDADPEVREFLVRLGKGAREVLGADVWLDATLPHKYGRTWYSMPATVVTDVRYANEAQRIHDLGGEVWRVSRPNCFPANTEERDSIELVKFDRHVFNNGGLNDLARNVHAVMMGNA